MDTLSDIFDGKVKGVARNTGVESQVFSGINKGNDMFKAKDYKMKASNIEKKLFTSNKKSKMNFFNTKNMMPILKPSKKMDLFSIKGNNTMPVLKPSKKIDFFAGTGYNNKKFNPQKMFSMPSSPENNAWNRMKTQKGLPMFGDYDRDGVPNILDCQPRNRYRQGGENNIEEYTNNGEIEYSESTVNEEVEEEPVEEETTEEEQPIPQEYVSTLPKDEAEVVAEYEGDDSEHKGVLETAKENIKGKWEGYWEEKEKEKQWQAEIKEQARKEALALATKEKAKKIYETEIKKAAGTGKREEGALASGAKGLSKASRSFTPDYYNEYYDYYGKRLPPGRRMPPLTPEQLMTQKVSSMTGFGGGMSTIPGGTNGAIGFAQKVRPLMGFGGVEEPTPVQQSQQQYAGTPQRREEGVYSPYSKKKVRYTRGPYRKR